MLRSLGFERRVAQLARREVRASPERWAVYRWQLMLNGLWRFVCLSTFLLMALAAAYLFQFRMAQVNNAVTAMTIQATVLSVLTLVALPITRVIHVARLRLVAYYPLADRRRYGAGWAAFLALGSIALVAPLPCWLGWQAGVGVTGWLVLPIIVLLQIGLLIGTPLIVATVFRSLRAQELVLPYGLAIVGFGLYFLGVQGRRPVLEAAAVAVQLLPANWAGAIWSYGILNGQAAAGLLVLPIVAFLLFTWRIVRSLQTFHELNVSSTGQIEPVFAPAPWWELPGGLKTADDVEPDDPFSTVNWQLEPRREPPRETLSSGWSAGEGLWAVTNGWQRQGPLESLFSRLLSDRERVVLHYWRGGPGSWSRGWCVALAGLLILALIATQFPPNRIFVRLLLFSVFMHTLPHRRNPLGDRHALLFAQFPLSLREVLRLNAKVAAWMFGWRLLPVFGSAVVVEMLFGLATISYLMDGLIVATLLFFWHSMSPCLVFLMSAAGGSRLAGLGFELAGLSLIGAQMGASMLLIILPLNEWEALIGSMVVVAACSYLVRSLWLVADERREFDLYELSPRR